MLDHVRLPAIAAAESSSKSSTNALCVRFESTPILSLPPRLANAEGEGAYVVSVQAGRLLAPVHGLSTARPALRAFVVAASRSTPPPTVATRNPSFNRRATLFAFVVIAQGTFLARQALRTV